MLMCTVFVVNGIAADFFIGMTLFITSMIGNLFFYVNPYKDPEAVYTEDGLDMSMDKMEFKIFDMTINILGDLHSK